MAMSNMVEILDKWTPFQGYLSVESVKLRHRTSDGTMSEPLDRQVLRRKDAVAILVRDRNDGRYVLVRQFRYACFANGEDGWLEEVVAGVIDHGETPSEAALREVWEETGLKVDSLRPAGFCYASPGTSTERYHLFFADATPAEGDHKGADDLEDIELVRLPLSDLAARVANGEVRDVKTLALIQAVLIQQPNDPGVRP
jgi:ADP-ribose pyrophosphatase